MRRSRVNRGDSVRTDGIVISRVNYGEADRIITFMTKDHGKVAVMARGVRRVKSKLAGAVELFSVSEIVYSPGRGKMSTLISARLKTHYGAIVQDVNRTLFGYDILKIIHKNTEDGAGEEYYSVLEQTLRALNIQYISLQVVRAWAMAGLLREAGHMPSLDSDTNGNKFKTDNNYRFDFERVGFAPHDAGDLSGNHIKVFKLIFAGTSPEVINHVSDIEKYIGIVDSIITQLAQTYFDTR